jgi:predicted RNA-binding Zn-ribbon protein involved in translation (DUF1610 family)
MIVQSACQASSPRLLASENLSRPNCPRCGSVVLVAEQSRFSANAFNAMGRIDHDWSCDDCGNLFATSIRLYSR